MSSNLHFLRRLQLEGKNKEVEEKKQIFVFEAIFLFYDFSLLFYVTFSSFFDTGAFEIAQNKWMQINLAVLLASVTRF